MIRDLRRHSARGNPNGQHPYADRWRWLRRSYAQCNRVSHHVLGFCIKALILAYLLFCIVCLVLRYIVLPQIGNYKGDIEQTLGSALGRQVSIASIAGDWQGLRPSLQMQQVSIRDQQGNTALVLPQVNLTISWLPALVGQLRFYDLDIERPELELRRSADGKISVAGWWIDPNQNGDARGLNWLLGQRQVQIKNGVLHWTDEQRGAPPLTLSAVNFVMQNHWQQHKLSLTAEPPAGLAGPVDVRAQFSHRPFTDNVSDYRQWRGQIYADLPHTDLAAWKAYFDYPIVIEQGDGAVQAWLNFDNAKLADFTADLRLTNVRTQLRNDLQMLDLVSVSGRISAQELAQSGGPLQLAGLADSTAAEAGHQISLSNFTFETRGGLKLPPTTMTEKYVPASKGNAQQLQLTAQFLDLNVLANLIEHFPIPPAYTDMLKDFGPSGHLSNFSISLQGDYPKLEHYHIKGNFSNLSMHAQPARPAQKDDVALPAIPGFDNLSGSIDSNERVGAIQIASDNLTLQLGDYFSEPEMPFDRFDMQATWEIRQNNQLFVNLGHLDLAQQDMHAHFSGTHQITISNDRNQSLGLLDLTGTVNRFDTQTLNRYLPKDTPTDLHTWLSKGIEHGTLDDVGVRIKGNLDEFPFVKKGLLDQNIFFVSGKIIDGKINYLPGVTGKDNVSPLWPELDKINGKITFDRQAMTIDADSAETAGVVVSKTRAVIPDLTVAGTTLQIDGTAGGAAQDMLHYLSISPVLEWIGNFTEDSKATGAMKLKLKLDLPLTHLLDARVSGSLQLNGNDVQLIRDLPVLSQTAGRIDFNEHGLSLNGLHAGFLGGTVAVIGGTQKDGMIRIKADGQISADGLRRTYPQPEVRKLLGRLDGNTAFSAVIQVKNKLTDIWVDSTLQGMALHLPAPLGKTAADTQPVHFELDSLAGQSGSTVEQDEVKVTVGKVLNARYLLQKVSEHSARKVVSGGIGVNVPAPMPDSGLAAYLELNNLNLDELQNLMPEKATGDGNRPAESADAEFALAQYLALDEIAGRSAELTLLGKKLDQVVFGASRINGTWQANVDSRQITGYLTWSNADHGLGSATARLSSLIIPDSAASDVVDLLQNKTVHASIPGLDVIADSFELFGKKLGKLELVARNASTGTDGSNEWQIEKMILTNPDAELTAEGKWSTSGDAGRQGVPKSQTSLKYALTMSNAGKTLERLGYAQVISGGKGKLTGDVSWAGSPYSLDIPTLSGKIQLDLLSGQFLKVEPGAAKLLAVLNLQALPRRLLLDFRDVFSEGFVFDGITADAQIDKGVLNTDNLKMRSVSATVLLSGSADIGHETQNLHVVVVPEVNAGAASVVYGLAVNPVIGLGTFLAQLFLRQPLMKAFTFEYQITGSWKEPNVVKL